VLVEASGEQLRDALEGVATEAVTRLGYAVDVLADVAGRLEAIGVSQEDRAHGEVAAAAELREGLRTEAGEVFRELRNDVADLLTGVDERTTEVLGALQVAEPTLRKTLTRNAREAQKEVFAGLEEVIGRLDEVGERIAERTGARTEGAVERLDSSAGRLESAIDRVGGIEASVEEVLGRATGAAREAAAEQATAVRDELATAVGELRRTVEQLSGSAGGMEELRRDLVGYLTERDAALEAQRDRLLVELLDEFVEGMSRREARRAAGQATEARDRARDRRDAARLRQLVADGQVGSAGGRVPGTATAPADPPPAPTPPDEPAEDPVVEPVAQPQTALDLGGDGEGAPAPDNRTCGDCGFVAKTPAGLSAHRRVHR
jgi:hypothetical protein